jgi:hypothetical protein
VSGLAILAAPESGRREDLARWIRTVSRGAAQLAQEAASEPGARLLVALAWLATDLAAICEAAANYVEDGECELEEDSDGGERVDEMRRLLEVGSGALGDSAESAFVRANIAKRLALETEASA